MKNTILTLVASVSLVAVCPAESYTLKLERPEKVGNKAQLAVSGLNQASQKIAMGGAPANEQATYEAGSLAADREILAVSDKGKATKIKLTVKSLKYTDDKSAEPKEILADGKEVTAERKDKKEVFTIDGKEADAATAKALKLVVDLDDEGKPMDLDAMLNTKDPHAVGDTWDASIDEVIKSMGNDLPFEFDRKASSGKIKLERIEKLNGIECGILTGNITMVPNSLKGLPEGSKLAASTFKLDLSMPVPTDVAAPSLGVKMAMNVAINADINAPDGTKAHLEMTGKMTREESITPAK